MIGSTATSCDTNELYTTPASDGLRRLVRDAVAVVLFVGVYALVAKPGLQLAVVHPNATPWWLGDATGAVVFAPPVLLWCLTPRLGWSHAQRLEFLSLVLGVAIVGWTAIVATDYSLAFLCIPLGVWAAVRFGQREAATLTSLSIIAIWGSFHGVGLLDRLPPNSSLLLIQSFMGLMLVVGLMLGAFASGQRLAEESLRQLTSELEQRVHQRTLALRQSEARLDQAQEVAHIGSWEWRIAENDLWWSHELYRMFGWERGTFHPSYETFLEIVHPEDRQAVAQRIEQAMDDRQPFEFERRMVRPDGDVRIIRSQGRVIQEGGRVVRMLGTAQDITERTRLEERLRQSQKLEAIGQLAGGIAHDFNNILTAIVGHAEILGREMPFDHPDRADLDEILHSADRAASLTRQLLAFGRKQVLQPCVLDLNKVVRDMQPMLSRLIQENITLKLATTARIGRVHADRSQIQQVILNLVINARDAMPSGGTLAIETADVTLSDDVATMGDPVRAGSYVLLAVVDTGVGMDAATQARIFEPFFTTKERGKGTGLGLATTYGIVKQSRGHIGVRSAPGHGTTFMVHLPRVERAAEEAPAPADKPLDDSLSGSETVLLVEDDEPVRRLAGHVLRKYGYTVIEATNGAEALARAVAMDDPVDLVVTDLVMPGLDGFKLLEHLKMRQPTVRALVMSGYDDDTESRRKFPEAPVAILHKPFTPATLLKSVREALARAPLGSS